jgi:TonB-linked SusC/RagA family outer membrane protein
MTKKIALAKTSTAYKKILLSMKLTLLLTICSAFHAWAGSDAQTISLKTNNKEIVKVLSDIESQGGFRFLFNTKLKELNQKVTVNFENVPLTDALQQVFAGTSLSYRLLDNNLVAIRSAIPEEQQDIRVTGRVTNEGGEGLGAASISIKGTRLGTSSDASGVFSLNAPENATLVISAIGYVTQEIKISGQQVINVKLVQSTQKMDQVVVIGYGSASKRDLTGSIVKISGKEVADKPNTNPVASLQSKVAGLSVVNNGTPGAAPDIRIRGTISIGSVSPLYVVDGVFNDNIDYINPNDIESIEILKDPSSLAIFGVKGAAGVIAITTKKARSGQTIINFNTAFGVKKLVDKIKLANASEFKTLFAEEKANIGDTSTFDYTPWTGNTDWIDAVTRKGMFNSNNLSISTATEKNKFSMGFGYTTDEGLIRHEKLTKIQLSINDEVRLNKVLKLGFNLNGTRQNAPYGYASNVLNDARKVVPIVSSATRSVYTKNPYGLDSARYNLYSDLPLYQNSGVVNPLLRLENEWDKTKNVEYRMVGSVFAELNLTRDLSFKSTFYADMSTVNNRTYTPLYLAYYPVDNSTFLYRTSTGVDESDNSYKKFQQDYILNYKKRIGDHSFSALAGWTTYYNGNFNRSASVKQSATGSPIPNDPRFWFIDNGFGDGQSRRARSSQRESSTASALFRVLYNYQGKYYLNASFRKDGSSQISPNNRWQNFWALGGAWEITREKFMDKQNILNFAKLKASIGVLGNQNTYGYDYPFYPSLVGGNAAVFGNNIYNAFSQAYLPNPNLRWETVHAKEVGIELGAFNNRLHFEAGYYNKITKELMTFIPGNNGAKNGLDNIGSIRNSGIELTASWDQKISNDFSITLSGNLTTYKNKVLELASSDFSIVSGVNRTTVGLPIGYFYGYIVEGIYQSYADKLASPVNTEFAYGPGDLKYKDVNGDGVINAKDRTMIGNPTPDFTYGTSVNLRYKRFEADFDFGGVYGNEIFRNWGATESPFQRVNYAAFKVDRWHGPGTSNWDPILAQDHRINYEASTYSIEDGSYFRIRNIQLSYNVNPTILKRARINNMKVFVNMQNPKTWKRNEGYTPEFGGSAISFGVDNAGGAIPSITTFGINITL